MFGLSHKVQFSEADRLPTFNAFSNQRGFFSQKENRKRETASSEAAKAKNRYTHKHTTENRLYTGAQKTVKHLTFIICYCLPLLFSTQHTVHDVCSLKHLPQAFYNWILPIKTTHRPQVKRGWRLYMPTLEQHELCIIINHYSAYAYSNRHWKFAYVEKTQKIRRFCCFHFGARAFIRKEKKHTQKSTAQAATKYSGYLI